MSDDVADLLADSREYIEKNGWWKGSLLGPNGRQVCAVGGLIRGMGLDARDSQTTIYLRDQPLLAQAVHRLAQVLVDAGFRPAPIEVNTITDWNDDRACCKQEVLDMFMQAEKMERSGNVDE